MKKTINLIVIAALVLSLLTACSCKYRPIINAGIGNIDGSNVINNIITPKVDVSNITQISDFSNGLAFVRYKDDNSIYCIDKTGAQLFALENCIISNITKFNNKVAVISTTNTNEYIICDKQGKIYKLEDFGASRIVLGEECHRKAFLDGYIILERREESYTGTKIEMSVIDSDFTTLVPFSVDLAGIIYKMDMYTTKYYNGYLYNYDTILDLRTGAMLSDRTQMKVSAPLLSYWRYGYGTDDKSFEHLQWGDIYNELTREVVANVKECKSISDISFVGNLGLATYYTDNGTWFNVIEQNGTAKFEPIKAGDSEILFDGEIILTHESCKVEKDNTVSYGLSVKTYDLLGNLLGEIFLESWGGRFSLNDGVIIVYNSNTEEYSLYNSTLEELF